MGKSGYQINPEREKNCIYMRMEEEDETGHEKYTDSGGAGNDIADADDSEGMRWSVMELCFEVNIENLSVFIFFRIC